MIPTLRLFALTAVLAAASTVAQPAGPASNGVPHRIDARMMRYPDISATQITFVYAGDIWVAPRTGGEAVRLSSPRGEETFPKFSPDGRTIAFSGNYDGNLDLYTIPVAGGVPARITHHGAPDRMIGWYPDGKSLLYATTMTSYKDRFNQLYKVSAQGGLPEKLPMPYGEFGTLSPDQSRIAFTTISTDFRTWKRYRGGMNPDIWVFDLKHLTAKNLTQSDAAESIPMWHEDTLYFLADRDEAKHANLWAYDFKRETLRQITHFTEHDVHFPSLGPDAIVFENAGQLFVLDLKTEKAEPVEITVTTDRATLKPRLQNISGNLLSATVSPTGKRALFEARGEIFSVPVEYGVTRNLTRSSGVVERYPAWSPDGKLITYFSDRTGEYELTVRNADSTGEERTLTKLGAGYRYQPQWSPDSKKITWIDQAMRIWVYDFDTKTNRCIDRQLWLYHGELAAFSVSWSADSRWLAYQGDQTNRNAAVILYDYKHGKRHQVTSGFYNDEEPVFDPDGKYLWLRTGRSFGPTYGEVDNTWIYANTYQLACIPLRKDVASPLAPRNDEETAKDKDKKADDKKDDDSKSGDKKEEAKKDGETKAAANTSSTNAVAKADAKAEDKKDGKKDDKKEDKKPKDVEIDLDGFEERLVILPTKAGRYGNLAAISGKLLYRWLGRVGSDGGGTPIEFWDVEKRETKTVVGDADGFELSGDRQKLLVAKGGYSIVSAAEGQNLNKKLSTGNLEATIDPRAEWRQLFTDAWRIQRDYFYDPGMHGVDWNAIRQRYQKLLDQCVTRWDVNYVIGEMIGELNASHAYRSGGETERAPERGVGYLGCDFTITQGAYRIARIINGAPWDSEVRSPLLRPGLTNVQEGDYLLAVNGEPVDTTKDPWAAFQGMAGETVLLTVNTNASRDGAHDILVQTLASEARLRNLAWINDNRLRVEKLSDGQLGYVFVPDTGAGGQTELVRQWRGQITKQGLVIDERFNSGGQIPDRFVELLNRPLRNYWGVRDGLDWPWPPVAQFGPKAMLINGWSGSGGDCFPFYFKQSGLGPLIGQRTWGGLIGMTGTPALIDGGSVTSPTFGIYNTKGEWIIEGYGVAPDIEVVDDPGLMARGEDPQLERGVSEVLKALRQNPPVRVRKPTYPNRSN